MNLKYFILILIPIVFSFFACHTSKSAVKKSDTTFKKTAPEWSKDAVIYEVNIRQFSKEGTFNAFRKDIPRLKELGVDILWLMPIYPISKEKRKGSLGSPYAAASYVKVNPDYGTIDDLKAIVKDAHNLGMKVILDWVPNHTGWDHEWIKKHPNWYMMRNDTIAHAHDPQGNPTDWYDVADLNYDNQDMRNEMLKSLEFWLKEADIDGYRFDVAGFVPKDFWWQVRPRLQAIKPVFVLNEWEDEIDHFNSVAECNYGWKFHFLCADIYKKAKKANDIWAYYEADKYKIPTQAYHMLFTSNHDENSWNGTQIEKFGDGADAFAVLCYTFDGIPLIYNGQESNINKRLAFFEKDEINWGNYSKKVFYQTLNKLKHKNPALWNGLDGGSVEKIITRNENVIAYKRVKKDNVVITIINLSDAPQKISLSDIDMVGEFKNLFDRKNESFENKSLVTVLNPWAYKVYFKGDLAK
ncbi:MAG: alpha-amylase [Saprospiraceae bacterium]|nr:alpha-amylase [Saprospiraceae bacterium]